MSLFKKIIILSIILTALLFLMPPGFSAEVHQVYDWWETSIQLEPPPPEFASCAACHQSLGISGGDHSFERKVCEDCHLIGREGPYVFYEFANLYRNLNYSSPMVYNHIIEPSNSEISYSYTGDVTLVEDQSNKFGGNTLSSCFGWNPATGEGTCHGISSNNPVDGFYAFDLSKAPDRESPYRYTVEAEKLPDTTDCLYCHTQSDPFILGAWGDPGQVDGTHFESTSNAECYGCHVDEGVSLVSFHKMSFEPNFVYLTPPEPTPPLPTTPPPTTTTLPTTTSSTSSTTSTSTSTTVTSTSIATTSTSLPSSTIPPSTPELSITTPKETPSNILPPSKKGLNTTLLAEGLLLLIIVIGAIIYFKKIKKKDKK